MRCIWFAAAAAVALFAVLWLSDGRNQDVGAGVIAGGQAEVHEIVQQKQQSEGIDEDAEFSSARSQFDRAVTEEISVNEDMLSEEMRKELEKIEASLADLLEASSGVEFSEDEIANMKEGFRTQLDDDVQKYIRDQADLTLEKEKTEFQLDLDRDAEAPKDEGEKEAEAQTSDILAVLRDKVDEICMDAKLRMKSLAAGAEKKILERTFEEKTSQSYVATISDENTVTSVEKQTEPSKTTKKAAKKAPTPAPTQAPKAKSTKKGTKKDPEPEKEEDEDEQP